MCSTFKLPSDFDWKTDCGSVAFSEVSLGCKSFIDKCILLLCSRDSSDPEKIVTVTAANGNEITLPCVLYPKESLVADGPLLASKVDFLTICYSVLSYPHVCWLAAAESVTVTFDTCMEHFGDASTALGGLSDLRTHFSSVLRAPQAWLEKASVISSIDAAMVAIRTLAQSWAVTLSGHMAAQISEVEAFSTSAASVWLSNQ